VTRLDAVKLAMTQETSRDDGRVTGYCLEAAVPLAALGLSLAPDLRLKLDWGVLVSGPEGTETFQRLYWANQQTAIVSDEARRFSSAARADLRALAARLVRELGWIAKVTLPFFFLMIGAVLLIWLFPGIVTFLPQQMRG
jgi:hypothetical protein